MRPEHADRLARLNEQGLVRCEPFELGDDHVERLPIACRTGCAAVDDEVVRALGDIGVEVVHETSEDPLGLPAAATKSRSDGGADRACTFCHLSSPTTP